MMDTNQSEWTSNPLVEAVRREAGDLMRTIRHDLHAHPELSFEEHRTAAKVRELLKTWGIPMLDGLGDTTVVGVLRSGTGTAAIGLRADMDALPIMETNTFEHASRHPGRMHACGHDGHTTMLLGAALYLNQHRDFDGTVYLIFQPAEENGRGARAAIDAGLFRDHPMQAVFGMHNWPGLAAGQFALTSGPIMASSSRVKVTYRGKGGHAALPEQTSDPVAAVATLYQALQTVVSRNTAAQDSVVLSITQLQGSDNHCVIPEQAWLGGSLRTLSPQVLERTCARIQELAQGIAAAFSCTAQVDIEHTVPATINDTHATSLCRDTILSWLGPKWLIDDFTPTMGAEDFAFMLQAVPGCYLMLGNGLGQAGDAKTVCGLHNPAYDFNDEVAPVGAAYWVSLVNNCMPLATPSA
ncbi:M20 aminoacylase family protein [Ottowia thiooxydans]|uniref:Hippurate hydrolase n=1 Tax=Ottowia thiooxydans TaxID=219182 RepID=A0ABV2QG79_9BURK